MKKKILSLSLLLAISVISLVGCGNSSETSKTVKTIEQTDDDNTYTTVVEKPLTEETPEEDLTASDVDDSFEPVEDLDSFVEDIRLSEDTKTYVLSNVQSTGAQYDEIEMRFAGSDPEVDSDGYYETGNKGNVEFADDCVFILLTSSFELKQVSLSEFLNTVENSDDYNSDGRFGANVSFNEDGQINAILEIYTP